MTKPNDEAMTPEQIQNWRKILLEVVGPYAFIMPLDQVRAWRDRFQKKDRRSHERGKAMSKYRCWWFGCEAHSQDPSPPEHSYCMHCGGWVDYGDMVGDTRHNRTKAWVQYWLWRKWWPTRCGSCCKRFGDHSECLPF